jgi:hypothetical protein
MTDNTERETIAQREWREKQEERVRQADLRMREWGGRTPQESLAKSFDPRSEVSADARYIVKHLWIIFVLLPVVLVILFEIFNRLAH